MNLRRKTQVKFDSKVKTLQQKIKTLELPKLQRSKVDDLNQFLKDPKSMQNQSTNVLEQPKSYYENVEPWMEVTQDSEALRKQKNIRSQINMILADQSTSLNQHSKSPESIKQDHKKIQTKLRKFQPTNGSFSLYYGQKKQNEEYVQKFSQDDSSLTKLINLPQISKFKSLSNQQSKSSQKRSLFLDSASRRVKKQSRMSRNNSDYQTKLKYIYSVGQSEHRNGQLLKGRINKYTNLFQGKYDKFNEECQNMVSDIGTYKLQEQTDKNYGAKFFQSLLNKKRL